MTGTPSRTATAPGGGTTRHSSWTDVRSVDCREGVWRGSCRRSSGLRNTNRIEAAVGWAKALGSQKPDVIRTRSRRCGRWMERRSRVLPREICLSANGEELVSRPMRAGRKTCPGCLWKHAPQVRANERATCSPALAREAARSTMDRQKSAEATVAVAHGGERAEQEVPNRREAFDA
jgi:hypothetical protein